MKIAYVTNVRLPSERAHGHQIAQVCDALTRLGHDVTVLAPMRKNVVGADFWRYYALPQSIKIEYFGSFDPIASPWLPGVLGLWWMNGTMRKAVRRRVTPGEFDLAYTRSPALLFSLVHTGVPVVLELHQIPRFAHGIFIGACNRAALVVCLTHAMADALQAKGVKKEKILVAGDAVDVRRFSPLPTKEAAREKFGVVTKRVVLGYVGRLKTLGMEKGVDTLLQAVKKDPRFFALVVGGPQADLSHYRARAAALDLGEEDVLFTGEVPARDVPAAVAACDIAAMPFPDLPHYRLHMSPLKMFEYMASSRPILTTDLPTVRDVLSEDTAWFSRPDDTIDFLRAAREIAGHPDRADEKVKAALQLVKGHTWEERMKRVLEPLRPGSF